MRTIVIIQGNGRCSYSLVQVPFIYSSGCNINTVEKTVFQRTNIIHLFNPGNVGVIVFVQYGSQPAFWSRDINDRCVKFKGVHVGTLRHCLYDHASPYK